MISSRTKRRTWSISICCSELGSKSMVASSGGAKPAQIGRRVLGVVGWQAAVIGLVDHQELEPAGAVLLVHLDAELRAVPSPGRSAQKLARQAEGRARAGLADEQHLALVVGDLIDPELPGQ